MHKSITRTQEKAFIVIIFVEMNGKSERESELAILMHQLSDVCSLSHSHHGVYRRARRTAAATLAPLAPKCYLSHKSPYCRQASITTSTPSKINALMSSSIVIHRTT